MQFRRETNWDIEFGYIPQKRCMLSVHIKDHKEFTTAQNDFQRAFTLLKSIILELQISCLQWELVKRNLETINLIIYFS